MVEVARDARARAELARAELRLGRAVDPAIPAAEVAVRKHAVAELAAEVEQIRLRRRRKLGAVVPDRVPEGEELGSSALELEPQSRFGGLAWQIDRDGPRDQEFRGLAVGGDTAVPPEPRTEVGMTPEAETVEAAHAARLLPGDPAI